MKKIALLITLLTFNNLSAFSQETTEPTTAEEEKEIAKSYGLSLKKIDPARFFNIATIQILDKTTAKSEDKEIKVGEEIEFGNIIIKVKKCWQAPLDQKPDSRILMEVFEKTPIISKESENNRIFYGWMIAASPSVSGLEHPVYDIVALNCKK
jgi:hypothetical protein